MEQALTSLQKLYGPILAKSSTADLQAIAPIRSPPSVKRQAMRRQPLTPIQCPVTKKGKRFEALQLPNGAPVVIVIGTETVQIGSGQNLQTEFGYDEISQAMATSEEGIWTFEARDRRFAFITEQGEAILKAVDAAGGFPPPDYSP